MASTPEGRFADLRGLRFHVRDWGGTGQPILLLHGLASNCRIWDFVAPLLAARFRVAALDQRGHGLSDKPDVGYDFDTVVADVRAVVRWLGMERPIMVGHSWGGNVALHYGATAPDEPRALVFVDGGFLDLSDRPWEQVERDLTPPQLAGMSRTAFVERMRSGPLGAAWRDELADAVLGNFEIHDDGTISPHLSRHHHMQIVRSLWEQRPQRLYPLVTCPVLMLPCDQANARGRDAAWREARRAQVAAAAARIPSVRTEWLRDSIHDVPLQRPQLVADHLARFAGEVA